MKWIEWVEPFGPNSEPVYCRVSEETAIAQQKKIASAAGKPYSDDGQALEDFIVVNWASTIETADAPTNVTESHQ